MNYEAPKVLASLAVLILLNGALYAGDAHPNFSPDDSQLVYMSGGEVKVVEIKTGKITNLTNSTTADMCPHWSHDGKSIVFDSRRDDPHRDIYVMGVDLHMHGQRQHGHLRDEPRRYWDQELD